MIHIVIIIAISILSCAMGFYQAASGKRMNKAVILFTVVLAIVQLACATYLCFNDLNGLFH